MKNKTIIEIIIHVFFWLICYHYFMKYSLLRYQPININVEYFSFSLIISVIYVNYFYFIPVFFTKQKLMKYFSSVFSLIILITITEFMLIRNDILLFTAKANVDFQNEALKFNIFGIFFRDTLFVAFFTMFKIYRDAIKANKLLQVNADLEKQYFISQMDTVKSKVNSHFFFNTLDSIYSLIVTKSVKASETVLNLSDLMRYVVAESDKKYVNLEKEINFLQNYIELEKIKDSSVNLSFEITGIIAEHEVPPMIFETFVNNAFKYTDFRNKGSVSIKLNCEPDFINFYCKNTLNSNTDRAENSTKKGLNNTRNRLNMIYKNNFKLDIKEEDGYFIVNLMLKKQTYINTKLDKDVINNF